MSMSSLAEEEVVTQDQAELRARWRPVVTERLTQAAAQANITLTAQQANALQDSVTPLAAAAPTAKTPGSSALDALVRYIPTETITIYVAAVAAHSALHKTFDWL